MLKVISLGAGVQSSCMALMAAEGKIEMPDGAIFADTHAEPQSVYRWLDALEAMLPFPVYRVDSGNLTEDSLEIRRSQKSGKLYLRTKIPAWTKSPDGSKGKLWRSCTADYKITPITRKLRELNPSKETMEQWIGISTDEAHRMKDSKYKWIIHRWPLIDAGMSRADCIRWLHKRGHTSVPRSSCTFCPFHSDKEWVRLKNEEPEGWGEAVEYERRNARGTEEPADTCRHTILARLAYKSGGY